MNEIFPKRLRGLRAASKLTQDEAANNIGIGKVTLARYELGGQSPTAENLEKIADYFCVPTDYLLGRIDTPYHVTSTTSAVTGEPLKGYTASGEPYTEEELHEIERAAMDHGEVVKGDPLEDEDVPAHLRELIRRIVREEVERGQK